MMMVFAFRFGPVRLSKDAVQEAFLRIFKQIDKVDLRRDTTARQYLTNAGVFAIRTFNRKVMRQNRRDKKPPERSVVVRDRENLSDLPPVLALYLEHIEATGTMKGAHTAVGRRLGVHKASAFRRFHEEARSFLEALQ